LVKQIEEPGEAIALPMKQADEFMMIGIKPPKGALMYPPGTGKTPLAPACATQTDACYLKHTGPSLNMPAIIFMDELDAFSTMCCESDKSGDHQVQSTNTSNKYSDFQHMGKASDSAKYCQPAGRIHHNRRISHASSIHKSKLLWP